VSSPAHGQVALHFAQLGIRPYLKKIWKATASGGTNGDVLVIRIKVGQPILPGFLYHLLASDRFFDYDTKHAKGAKMPRGDRQAVLDYPIPLPPWSNGPA
jgi:type I restriction enzyme S subunit